ncbi:MAG: C2H2-type zinc finger protein [Bacteroidota bacterium]
MTAIQPVFVPVPLHISQPQFKTYFLNNAPSNNPTYVNMANCNVLPPSNNNVSLWNWNTPTKVSPTNIPQFNSQIQNASACATPIISPSTSITPRSMTPKIKPNHQHFSFPTTTLPTYDLPNLLLPHVQTGAPYVPPSSGKNLPQIVPENDTATPSLPLSSSRTQQKKKTYKAFQCLTCSKRFARKGNLQEHERLHAATIEEKRPFKCTKCLKRFTQLHTLTDHFRTHTGEKPFKCDICGKAFSVKNNMKVHRLIHSGEKPYACVFCSKKFKSFSGLNGHKKRLHEDKLSCPS